MSGYWVDPDGREHFDDDYDDPAANVVEISNWRELADRTETDCEPTTDLSKFGLLDWTEVLSGEPKPVEWIVPQVFATGKLYQLVAQPKKGKSLFAQDVALHAATDGVFEGSVVPEGHQSTGPVPVLYLDAENGRDIIEARMVEMGADAADMEHFHYASFPAIPPLDTEDGAAKLLELVERLNPELIFLDTVSRFVRGNENDSQTYLDLYRLSLAPLKRQGRTVVRIDHLGKDPGLGARGSSAKSGDVDVSWLLLPGATPQRIKLVREFDRTTAHPEVVNLVRRQSPLRHEVVQGRITIGQLAADEELSTAELPDEVRGLVEDLDARSVSSTVGRDRAREAYIAAGGQVHAANGVWSAAVAFRKARNS